MILNMVSRLSDPTPLRFPLPSFPLPPSGTCGGDASAGTQSSWTNGSLAGTMSQAVL